MRYYHGSVDELEVGTRLSARGAHYEAHWGRTDFYAALERWRPEGRLAHRDAVFLVGDPDDVDLAGGGTDWIFECEPVGEVTAHDLNWSSEVSGLVSNGCSIDDPRVRDAATAYWRGDAHPNEGVWEYLAKAADIVRVEPYETFAP